ncbi:hypothetical protein PP997_gp31 [Gordonia phage BigChungus]|uniref:Uncharacterized protein n=1 Tax=Gordonia phage BigChungus TaxID=2762389 RepID=A0A7G8LQK9_9CAUD|nr:hypothetical protein PP997_gp31 [Gordonia phage BigChungus]QNJ59391.1 hypothetical protein SEA_FEASTONYEET_31 [Gordonia phage Feastonyeet]QNJ59531.1 hypothetical protein SEA_BIGCHUNGUS_31 [Gordonia phage BigChungus]
MTTTAAILTDILASLQDIAATETIDELADRGLVDQDEITELDEGDVLPYGLGGTTDDLANLLTQAEAESNDPAVTALIAVVRSTFLS